MMPPYWQFLVLTLTGWLNRHQQTVIDYLQEENRVLREQLGPKRLRFSDPQRRRLATAAKALSRKALREVASLVTPDTLLGWYRRLVARKYDGSRRRGLGRPPKPWELRNLVVRMGRENPIWGYSRIQGALWNLGHEVGRTTVKRILQEHGLDPASERGKRTSWSTFLKAHREVLAAVDLFSVEVLTFGGLVRHRVFLALDVASRCVQVAGIAVDPTGRWMEQMARNMTDAVDGFLRGKRFVIHDRDPIFTEAFEEILKSVGIHPVRLPPRSPNLNAFAERWIRSIKSECLDRMIFPTEASLRRAIEAYLAHYHAERNHQGLGNRLIAPLPFPPPGNVPVRRRDRLGGMLRYYYREAA